MLDGLLAESCLRLVPLLLQPQPSRVSTLILLFDKRPAHLQDQQEE